MRPAWSTSRIYAGCWRHCHSGSRRRRRAVLHRQIDLRLPVALVRSEAGEQRIAQRLVPRPIGERDVLEAGQIVTEDGQRAVVGRAQRAIGGECQHAGRQVGEHALQIHPRRFDRSPATVGCRTRILEVAPDFAGLHADLLDGSFVMRDGYVLPPDRPGLGIVLTDEIKARYPFRPGSGEFNSVPGKILRD